MHNNDVLRSLRYAMDCSDAKIARFAELGGIKVDKAEVSGMLKKEDDAGFLPCSNAQIDAMLDGLIIERRGQIEPKPDQPPPAPIPFGNNGILKKLRIAFELREEDILAIMELADFRVSKPEVGALFRKEGHKNYRPCGDQFLRYFLKGLALRLRTAKS